MAGLTTWTMEILSAFVTRGMRPSKAARAWDWPSTPRTKLKFPSHRPLSEMGLEGWEADAAADEEAAGVEDMAVLGREGVGVEGG